MIFKIVLRECCHSKVICRNVNYYSKARNFKLYLVNSENARYFSPFLRLYEPQWTALTITIEYFYVLWKKRFIWCCFDEDSARKSANGFGHARFSRKERVAIAFEAKRGYSQPHWCMLVSSLCSWRWDDSVLCRCSKEKSPPSVETYPCVLRGWILLVLVKGSLDSGELLLRRLILELT